MTRYRERDASRRTTQVVSLPARATKNVDVPIEQLIETRVSVRGNVSKDVEGGEIAVVLREGAS